MHRINFTVRRDHTYLGPGFSWFFNTQILSSLHFFHNRALILSIFIKLSDPATIVPIRVRFFHDCYLPFTFTVDFVSAPIFVDTCSTSVVDRFLILRIRLFKVPSLAAEGVLRRQRRQQYIHHQSAHAEITNQGDSVRPFLRLQRSGRRCLCLYGYVSLPYDLPSKKPFSFPVT